MLYNVPGRTGVNMDVETTLRLSEIPNIVGDQGSVGERWCRWSEIVSGAREDFHLLSGDDPVTVAAMAVGGAGVVSVASNEAPAEMVQIVELCEKGDFAGRAQAAPLAAAADSGELRRDQSHPVQGGDGGDGAASRRAIACRWCRRAPAARDKVMRVLQQLKMLGAAARV